MLRDPPGWEGEPPEAPGRARRAEPPGAVADAAARAAASTRASRRTIRDEPPDRRLSVPVASLAQSVALTTSGSSSVAMKISPMPVAITGRDL